MNRVCHTLGPGRALLSDTMTTEGNETLTPRKNDVWTKAVPAVEDEID